MARLSDRKTLSNEEIEASVEELSRKLEILRVRYEQYFIGVEKVAPSVMRMEVVRIMRDLEQLKIKNTAIKFKLRTVVQKFTSYSTYWNRTLREIEDGTYKRHVDKAKREAERLKKASAQPSASRQNAAQTSNDNRSSQTLAKDVANEADDFLASLGYAPTPNRQNVAMNSQNVQSQVHHPVSNSMQSQSGAPTPEQPAAAQQALRRRRPAIVGAQTSARPTPTQQTASAAQARHVATACAACAVQAHHVAATFAACHADAFASHSRRATTTNPVVASACGSTFDASNLCRAVRGAQSCTIFAAHACGASAATAAFAASDAPTASDRPPIVAARSAQSHARSHGLAIDASPRATDQR